MPSDQSRIIEQAKFTYLSFRKSFLKANKADWKTRKIQVEALEVLKSDENKEDVKSIDRLLPKDMRTNEIKNEINYI